MNAYFLLKQCFRSGLWNRVMSVFIVVDGGFCTENIKQQSM